MNWENTKQIWEYNCQIFPEKLVLAYLTYLQWSFNVKRLLTVHNNLGPFCLSRTNWPWKVTVGLRNHGQDCTWQHFHHDRICKTLFWTLKRSIFPYHSSNNLGPTFQGKYKIVICRSHLQSLQPWEPMSEYILGIYLPRGSKLRWHEDIREELWSVWRSCVGWSLQPIGLQRIWSV